MRRRRNNSGGDAGAALLAAAATADTAERLSPLTVLRARLAEYTQLAETARLACDMAAYTLWSERSARAAADLLPYEPPADGSKVTRFPLAIFDSQRRPLNLELTAAPATPASPAASAPEGAASVQQPAGENVNAGDPPPETNAEVLPPEVPPEDPQADAAAREADKLAWRRSMQWQALFGGTRQPCGSRHRW